MFGVCLGEVSEMYKGRGNVKEVGDAGKCGEKCEKVC